VCSPTIALVALAAGSGALSTYSTFQQASAAKQTAKVNATLADRAAADALARGEKQAMDLRRQGSLMMGSQRAALAARGLDLQEGTPADLQDQTDFFSQSDQATARTNARKEAAGYMTQAGGYRTQASAINPALSAGGTLLGSASAVAGHWYSLNPGGATPDGAYNQTENFKMYGPGYSP
jgi:hypothetical protein